MGGGNPKQQQQQKVNKKPKTTSGSLLSPELYLPWKAYPFSITTLLHLKIQTGLINAFLSAT